MSYAREDKSWWYCSPPPPPEEKEDSPWCDQIVYGKLEDIFSPKPSKPEPPRKKRVYVNCLAEMVKAGRVTSYVNMYPELEKPSKKRKTSQDKGNPSEKRAHVEVEEEEQYIQKEDEGRALIEDKGTVSGKGRRNKRSPEVQSLVEEAKAQCPIQVLCVHCGHKRNTRFYDFNNMCITSPRYICQVHKDKKQFTYKVTDALLMERLRRLNNKVQELVQKEKAQT